jgi:hypothetical protein
MELPEAANKPSLQYCTLIFAKALFQKKVFRVEFGTDTDLLQYYDAELMANTEKVSQYTTDMDALNYLAALGWRVVPLFYGDRYDGFTQGPKYLLEYVKKP